MIYGDFVQVKKLPLKIELISLNLTVTVLMVYYNLDPIAQAANAVAARDAAAARALLTQQQLQTCQEENNPYTRWGGGIHTNVEWAVNAPNPCLPQQKAATAAWVALQKLSGATTTDIAATEIGQNSAAPTSQDLQSAPAPQLATAFDPAGITDPAIPESEFSPQGMNNLWSPTSIEEIMTQIAMEMDNPPNDQDMLDLEDNLRKYRTWWLCWGKPLVKTEIKWKPKNQNWVGWWTPR